MQKNIVYLLLLMILLYACRSQPQPKEETPAADTAAAEGTPVTVTGITTGRMADTVELNAVSAFLLRTYVKATATGYLQAVNTQMGNYVQKGQELFVLKTKEAQSLGNTLHILDSSLHFAGIIHIKSPGSGYVTQLTYRAGDYVQDNEQLATITDTKNFVFLLNLPYELTPYLAGNRNLRLRLPDGTVLDGQVQRAMPTVDSASQTQNFMIRVNTTKAIPENLIAKVTLVKQVRDNITSLPKSAVLSDEVQSQFWIMKLIDSVTAVKVPVQKGIETADRVEIRWPKLSPADKILITGNYGLADTAKVSIIK